MKDDEERRAVGERILAWYVKSGNWRWSCLAMAMVLASAQLRLVLADLSAYQGKYADAARILTQGAAGDVAAMMDDNAARKYAALGNIETIEGNHSAALSTWRRRSRRASRSRLSSWRPEAMWTWAS